jgi:hypothetical protein
LVGLKVTYLSAEPSRHGAEIAHMLGEAEIAKSETEVDGVGLSAANVAPTYVHPAVVESMMTEDDVLNAVNKDVVGVAAVRRRTMSLM